MENVTIKLPPNSLFIESEEYLTRLFDTLLVDSETGIQYPTSYPCYAVRTGDFTKVSLLYLYPVCAVG